MGEKKQPTPAWRFLAKHGEKVGLAVAVLALSSVLIGQLAAKEDPNLERLDLALRKADASFRTPRPEDLPPRPKAWETAAVAPWNSVSTARGADDWSASLYSELRPRVVEPPKAPPVRLIAPTVELGKAQAQLDGVALAWSVREPEPLKGAVTVGIVSFRIERETAGRWEPLAELVDPRARSFTDPSTQPRMLYRYRVTATSKHADLPVIATLTTEPLKTPGLWRLEYQNPTDGGVWVTIEKYEKALATKVVVKHLHQAGDAIGRWPEREGAEPTSKHRVQVAQRSHEVDFDTKTTLVSVEPKKLSLPIRACKQNFDPRTGVYTGCDALAETQDFSVHEIVLQGPDGREVVLSPTPRPLDRLCRRHAPK